MDKVSNWTFHPIFINISNLIKIFPEESLLPNIIPPLIGTNGICGRITKLTTLKHTWYISLLHDAAATIDVLLGATSSATLDLID